MMVRGPTYSSYGTPCFDTHGRSVTAVVAVPGPLRAGRLVPIAVRAAAAKASKTFKAMVCETNCARA